MSKSYLDRVVSRRKTGSVKWKENDVIPMWVADMDFPVAPAIIKGLKDRIAHPIYGYVDEDPLWAKEYHNFWKKHYGLDIIEENLHYSHGVVPIVSSFVRAFSKLGEEVILMTPVYNVFYHSVENNDRIVSSVPFVYKRGEYSVDFALLEQKMASKNCHAMVLCNPQNPLGRIFPKEELQKIASLAKKHGIVVLSDEIHGPISEPGHPYIPFLSVSEDAEEVGLCALSPTKAFNLAGIQSAAVYAKKQEFADLIAKQLNIDECNEPNILSLLAAELAFSCSEDWLQKMNRTIARNRKKTKKFFKEECPLFHMVDQDATYLLWVDVSKLTKDDEGFAEFLKKEAKVWVNPGSHYGKEGEGFLRINVACPLSTLEEGLARIKKGYDLYQSKK